MLYNIDTEGSFTPQRVDQIGARMITYAKQKIKHMTTGRTNETNIDISTLTIRNIMNNIQYIRIYDSSTLTEYITYLSQYLSQPQNSKIRLIIIDSIAYHFRYGFSNNYSIRNRILIGVANELNKIAKTYNICVVMTNHMTTQFGNNNNTNQQTTLKPALGDTWATCAINNRVILQYIGNKRVAVLQKLTHNKPSECVYSIDTGGITDVQQQ